MAEDLRVERGWIYVDGSRGDDGRIARGTGGVLRLNPFEAFEEREDAGIPVSAVLKASFQRLAFWRVSHGPG
jgi:hypothetical protein